jgi:hypothetical protein
MNLNIEYSKPLRTDICVAFCFFSPCGFIRPLQNLTFFENKLKLAGIPYYSIELVIGDKPNMLANPTVRLHSKSSLFYKEALWNRLEREIPAEYTKIAFLDSDVIFSDPEWLDKLSTLLDSSDLVHPFETVDRLNLSYTIFDTLISSLKDDNNLGCGMGWAITRELFHQLGGFFDRGILGNGDTLFYNCIKNTININSPLYYLVQNEYTSYRNNFINVSPIVTYLNCKIYHLSHGTIHNRQYGTTINVILGSLQLPWMSVFSVNTDGLWELMDESLNKKMIQYFIDRKEDSEDIDSILIRRPRVGDKNASQKAQMNVQAMIQANAQVKAQADAQVKAQVNAQQAMAQKQADAQSSTLLSRHTLLKNRQPTIQQKISTVQAPPIQPVRPIQTRALSYGMIARKEALLAEKNLL